MSSSSIESNDEDSGNEGPNTKNPVSPIQTLNKVPNLLKLDSEATKTAAKKNE